MRVFLKLCPSDKLNILNMFVGLLCSVNVLQCMQLLDKCANIELSGNFTRHCYINIYMFMMNE